MAVCDELIVGQIEDRGQIRGKGGTVASYRQIPAWDDLQQAVGPEHFAVRDLHDPLGDAAGRLLLIHGQADEQGVRRAISGIGGPVAEERRRHTDAIGGIRQQVLQHQRGVAVRENLGPVGRVRRLLVGIRRGADEGTARRAVDDIADRVGGGRCPDGRQIRRHRGSRAAGELEESGDFVVVVRQLCAGTKRVIWGCRVAGVRVRAGLTRVVRGQVAPGGLRCRPCEDGQAGSCDRLV